MEVKFYYWDYDTGVDEINKVCQLYSCFVHVPLIRRTGGLYEFVVEASSPEHIWELIDFCQNCVCYVY